MHANSQEANVNLGGLFSFPLLILLIKHNDMYIYL